MKQYIYNSKYLKQLRQNEKLPQKLLALKLNISLRQIQRLESGDSNVNLKMINKYATFFKEFDINNLFVLSEIDESKGDDKRC